jgi:hypothetical protein
MIKNIKVIFGKPMKGIKRKKRENPPKDSPFKKQSILSHPDFMPKPSTHRMHDPGSIVPHIWPKVFPDNQMSRIKYNYYINSVSKDYDDSQRNGTAEDSITPQERQPGQHVA